MPLVPAWTGCGAGPALVDPASAAGTTARIRPSVARPTRTGRGTPVTLSGGRRTPVTGPVRPRLVPTTAPTGAGGHTATATVAARHLRAAPTATAVAGGGNRSRILAPAVLAGPAVAAVRRPAVVVAARRVPRVLLGCATATLVAPLVGADGLAAATCGGRAATRCGRRRPPDAATARRRHGQTTIRRGRQRLGHRLVGRAGARRAHTGAGVWHGGGPAARGARAARAEVVGLVGRQLVAAGVTGIAQAGVQSLPLVGALVHPRGLVRAPPVAEEVLAHIASRGR